MFSKLNVVGNMRLDEVFKDTPDRFEFAASASYELYRKTQRNMLNGPLNSVRQYMYFSGGSRVDGGA